MKAILILLLFSFQAVFGQTENMKILKATDEALDTWAPGYNRKYGTPSILHMNANKLAESKWKNAISTYHGIKERHHSYVDKYKTEEEYKHAQKRSSWVGEVLNGREFYIVTYMYDKEYEIFRNGYAAQVFIWRDSYMVFRIGLGDGPLLTNLDEPEYQHPFKRIIRYTPELMKDRLMPEIIIDEQGREIRRAHF